MAQRPGSEISQREESPAGVNGDHTVLRRSAELRLERSRFSRLLARFGLGELTAPILRPTKRSAEEGRAG
jgi:hypothetical protein